MNNPPAFPNVSIRTKEGTEIYGDSGMSLRDYMAAKAMQGMLADPSTPEIMDIAGAAYEVADAMLAARESK
jgi:hypothetical protein